MEALPEGLAERDLVRGLAEFGIEPESLVYAPVGFGDYHWVVDGRWFATVADVARKSITGLRRAMRTAQSLREALEFVVAPLPAADGDVVVPLDDRYALSVFPHLQGTSGRFGERLGARERDDVLGLLAALHTCAPPEGTPVTDLAIPGRAELEAALREDWAGGPFSAPARDLFAEHADALRAGLADFDRLAAETRHLDLTVTHGELHPGNLLRTAAGHRLVDWDTVGLAAPERDLWLLGDDLTRYTELTGHVPDPNALALHRLRWSLVDLAEFAALFRRPHTRTPDTDTAWRGLRRTLAELASGARG